MFVHQFIDGICEGEILVASSRVTDNCCANIESELITIVKVVKRTVWEKSQGMEPT